MKKKKKVNLSTPEAGQLLNNNRIESVQLVIKLYFAMAPDRQKGNPAFEIRALVLQTRPPLHLFPRSIGRFGIEKILL